MRRFLIASFLIALRPLEILAQAGLIGLLPNPAGDDTIGEYIEVRNLGCETLDITGYILADLSGKTYSIPSGTFLGGHENRRFSYGETKISLNNTGDEAIFLRDVSGDTIDEYHYTSTQKDDIMLSVSQEDEDCSIPIDLSGSGALSTDSGSSVHTGGIDSTVGESATLSGLVETGILMPSEIASGSTSTGDLTTTGATSPPIGSLSGEVSGTGFLMDTGSSSSGITTETGELSLETGAMIPGEMYYSDIDGNNKIDTLEIVYPYELTGSVYVSEMALFSKSGGLSSEKIDSLTGKIQNASLSGNILILRLIEGNLEKTTLQINNTTSSDLRLKSSGDLGFRSISGHVPLDFLLTKSFDSYRKVYRRDLWGTEIISSGSGEIGVPSGGSGEIFPEISPSSQSPTNAIYSGGVFTCVSTDCRINITLESIFSNDSPMKNFRCYFGTGEVLLEDTDCNPNTFYFSSGGNISIELVAKSDSLLSIRKIYPVEWNVTSKNGNISLMSSELVPDTGKPVVIIDIDGKEKEYYEKIGDYEMNCYTATCSINWTAERSYDPEGSTLGYLWIYGPNEISTSKDPGTRKYPLGDHRMILRVIDTSGNFDEITYLIHVLGPKPKIIKEKISKTPKKKETISEKIMQKKKKIKKMKMAFFSPPEILLQGKTGLQVTQDKFICEYKRVQRCSFNITLTGATIGYEYRWILDEDEMYLGKNPKAWKLTPGMHSLKLLSFIKGSNTPIMSQIYSIQVSAEPKKPKIIKPKKLKIPKVSQAKLIPESHADKGNIENTEAHFPMTLPLVFFAGVGTVILLRRKIGVK